jgi:hypothetical protein
MEGLSECVLKKEIPNSGMIVVENSLFEVTFLHPFHTGANLDGSVAELVVQVLTIAACLADF